jgi:hypothetical protein
MISGSLELNGPGSLPLERYIAPVSVWLTGGLMVWRWRCRFEAR